MPVYRRITMLLFLLGCVLSVGSAGPFGCSRVSNDNGVKEGDAAKGNGEDVSAEVARLKELVRSKDRVTREKAIGKLLPHVKQGMLLAEVKDLLGPPVSLKDGGIIGDEGTVFATYFARLAKGPAGRQMMTVHFKQGDKRVTVIEVRGPHFPD